MRTTESPPDDILDTLHQMQTCGYGDRLRPLHGKQLAHRERGPYTAERLEYFIRTCRMNLGIRLHGCNTQGGLVVVDCDGHHQGPFAGLKSPMMTLTKRGRHTYHRTTADHPNLIHPGGLDIDVLFHSVPPLPGSRNPDTGWPYTLAGDIVSYEELPLFPMELLREFEPPAPERLARVSQRRIAGHIRDVRAYVSRIMAIEGHGGDRMTFRVACIIAKATVGNYHETLSRLRDWNATNAHPRWTEKELAHKAACAVRSAGAA